jgi:transcriptional regulator with XRE-family HTH domain
MTFAQQLRAEQARLGMTQPQLAAALDVSERTVSHWLTGSREPLPVAVEGVLARLARLPVVEVKTNKPA